MSETATEPTVTPEAAATEAPKVEADKTFTQADLDRILAGRLAKYADYDDLKTKVAEVEQANATDLEKAVAKAREETATEVTERANKRLVSAEVRAVASELGFRDPTDALAQFGDLAAVTVSEEGEPDAAAVKARLADIAKAKPYLLKDTNTPVAPAGSAGIGVTGAPAVQVSPGMGRLQHAYATTSK